MVKVTLGSRSHWILVIFVLRSHFVTDHNRFKYQTSYSGLGHGVKGPMGSPLTFPWSHEGWLRHTMLNVLIAFTKALYPMPDRLI